MLKDIKTWFTKKDTGETTVHVEANLIAEMVKYEAYNGLQRMLVEKIAEEYLAAHGEEITRDILNNPNFADAVYNAIVLKKAEKL